MVASILALFTSVAKIGLHEAKDLSGDSKQTNNFIRFINFNNLAGLSWFVKARFKTC